MSSDTQPPAGTDKDAAESPKASAVSGRDRVVGSALRSVYQATVDESIPDDLLDLLGKLS